MNAAMGLLPRSGEIDAEQAYEKLKGLIYRLVHNFHRQFGGDFDEMVSEANWIFLKAVRDYDPNRGAQLITYVYTKVYWGLRDTLKKRDGYLGGDHHFRKKHLTMDRLSISDRTSIGERLNRLSEEAAAVVNIALFIRGSSPTAKRRHLIEILREYGWAAEEILDCFNEIKEAL